MHETRMSPLDEQPTLDDQLASLRSMGQPWVGPMAKALFVLPALILLYRAFAFREYPLIVFVVFFAFFAGLISQGMPHIRRAIAGIEASDRVPGKAKIRIEEGMETERYVLEVVVAGRGAWTFDFRPQHWAPEDDEADVECRFIPEVGWPALVLSDKGIMYPTQAPKTLHHSTFTNTFQ